MTTIYPSLGFDYINRQFNVSVIGTGRDWTTAGVTILAPEGYIAGISNITATSSTNRLNIGSSDIPMQMNYTSYQHENPSSANKFLWQDYLGNFVFSAGASGAFLPFTYEMESGLIDQYNLSQTDDVYSGLPVIITRGDSVGYFYISAVSGKNYINYASRYYFYQNDSSMMVGQNLNHCIGEALNGAVAGQRFFVTSHNTSNTGLFVDKDLSSWSGVDIKLMPYRIINDYSGWEDWVVGTTTRFQGPTAEFTLNENTPTTIGQLDLDPASGVVSTAGATSVLDVWDIYLPASAPNGFATNITLANMSVTIPPITGGDIRVGDIAVYSASGGSAISTGIILSVAGIGGLSYDIQVYPAVAPDINSDFTIRRNNDFSIITCPKFDTDYTIVATEPKLALVGGSPILSYSEAVGFATARSPSAEIEVSANDHESTYSLVGERSHFHIGPVSLSNGQRLNNDYLLELSAHLYHGDVTTTTPQASWIAHGTMGTDLGASNSGNYLKSGILTVTYPQAFSASETLYLIASAQIGAAKIDRVIPIPVQPSI